MKERPILFGAPMVRALIAGSKTQTRRIVKPHHLKFFDQSAVDMVGAWDKRPFPYGKPGDRLWVREAWAPKEIDPECIIICYRATDDECNGPWKPSIHMPRWASRITLEITGVRVERLQEISEADAIAEGCQNSLHLPGGRFANENYAHLWWSIHGDESWEKNPWVWVIEFKKVRGGA